MKVNQALATLPLAVSLVAAAPTLTRRSNILDGKSVATWWGQDTHELKELCADSSFDIIMLSFLTQLTPPVLNLGAHAGGPSAAQKAKGWNLVDGTVAPTGTTSVQSQISACQAAGKKVMISFGGDSGKSDAKFDNDADAKASAAQLYNLLLGGKDTSQVPANVRPFGSVVLDGVDLDNETGQSAFYDTFVSTLRGLMDAEKRSSPYYISGSPQVPNLSETTGSIPDSIYKYLDFINVQFYNNAGDTGELGHPDFVARVGQWNDKIKKLNPATKLMVAAPVSTLGATGHDVGVRSASEIASDIAAVKAKSYSQFGGFSLWAGGWAMDNNNWQQAVKKALTGGTANTQTPATGTYGSVASSSTAAPAATTTGSSNAVADAIAGIGKIFGQ